VGDTELFDDSYFQRLAAARSHWWCQGMQLIGASLLGETRSGLRVLDAGCGTGASFEWLRPLAGVHPVYASDVAWPAVQACHRTADASVVVQASITDMPYPDGFFDVVVCADVLQHLTRPQATRALAEVYRVLRPGGRVVIRTNAAFGRQAVHERDDWILYRPETLRQELEGSGMKVTRLTSVNMLQSLWASLPRRRPHSHVHPPAQESGATHVHHAQDGVCGLGLPTPAHPAAQALLLGVLRLEARWLSGDRRTLPFGHTLVAVAQRPMDAALANDAIPSRVS